MLDKPGDCIVARQMEFDCPLRADGYTATTSAAGVADNSPGLGDRYGIGEAYSLRAGAAPNTVFQHCQSDTWQDVHSVADFVSYVR